MTDYHFPADRPETGCVGKEPYATRSLAERVLKRRRLAGKRDLVVYRCESCGAFHHGSRPKLKPRKRP